MKIIILCILSSTLLFISFPKTSFWPVAFVSLIPMLLAVKEERPLKSFLFGLITGTLAYCGILYWLVPTFLAAGENKITGFAILILLSLYLAVYFGGFCALYSAISARFPAASFFGLFLPAFLWVTLEFARAHIFTGFPWALLGYTQWNNLPIIQISEFTGVYGVSFLIVLVNLAITNIVTKKQKLFSLSNLTVFSLISASLIFGFYRLGQPLTSDGTPATISILQGNIDQYKKWDYNFEKSIKTGYEELAVEAAGENPAPSVIVWPETAAPGYLRNEKNIFDWARGIAEKTKTQHLIGSIDYENGKTYNSAFLISEKGDITGAYSKIHLVPFGEYMPLKKLAGKFVKVANEIGETTPGKSYNIINSSAGKLGVNICFEAIFPDEVRKSVKNGAEIIVNITNDAWYLDTSAPHQHFTINVFRAVENRRPVVRAANTGISGFIDRSGRITSRTQLFTNRELTSTVLKNSRLTFYARFGDIFCWICFLAAIIALTIHRKRV